MSNENKGRDGNGNGAPREELVRVKLKTRYLVKRDFFTRGDGHRESTDTYAQPGEIVEVTKAEAARLLGRSFEGYPSAEAGRTGPEPGVVSDPLAVIAA